MHRLFVFVVSLFIVSCFQDDSAPEDSEFLPAQRLAELTDKRLEEVSGITMSVANPGMFWVHNDSGNPAVVYLIDDKLQVRLACTVKDVRNRDWEDIAIGPGPDPDKRYVYVADIGDNNGSHKQKYIYRFPEPVLSEQNASEMTITEFDTIVFKLEDGNKDTETIMIHPATKNIYFVSKREKPVFVYELKFPFADDTLTASKVASLPLTQIVGGDISPQGNEILMKNYDNIYYWDVDGMSLSDGLKNDPELLEYTEEPQGEAIAFSSDGSGFYTLSEKIKGEKTYLYFYARRK